MVYVQHLWGKMVATLLELVHSGTPRNRIYSEMPSNAIQLDVWSLVLTTEEVCCVESVRMAMVLLSILILV